MKRAVVTLSCCLILALGAGWVEAQQQQPPSAAKKQRVRKAKRVRMAKKVWTNDDFPERRAPKAEPAPAKGEAEAQTPEAAKKKKEKEKEELLKKLGQEEGSARSNFRNLVQERDAIQAEITALEKKRASLTMQEAQVAVTAQIEQKKKDLAAAADRTSLTSLRIDEISRKKEALHPPKDE